MTFTVVGDGSRGTVKLTLAGITREVGFNGSQWASDNRLRDPAVATIIDAYLDAGTTSGTLTITTS